MNKPYNLNIENIYRHLFYKTSLKINETESSCFSYMFVFYVVFDEYYLYVAVQAN